MANSDKQRVEAKLLSLFPNGCSRILFVNPPHVPEEDYEIGVALDSRYPVYPPYGLGILSRDLINRGYRADIIDLNYSLQERLQRDQSAFRYQIWKDLLRKKIEEFDPDLVGLTCMFTVTHRQVVRTAEYIKKCFPALPVIAGGVHATCVSAWLLQDCRNIDFVSLFEGNICFGDLLDFLNGNSKAVVTQLATRIGDDYIALSRRLRTTAKSLDLIPYYHDLSIGNYSSLGRIGAFHWLIPPGASATTVLANRGCRGRCSFCSVRFFNGKEVSVKSIDVIVDEIEKLRDRYGITHIMWLDDDLLYDSRRTISLFNSIIKRNLGITWDATNGIIASAMTNEIAQAAAESGCIALGIGIESGNPEILKSVRKPSGVKHFVRCAEILKKYAGIFTKGLLMVGFPNETIGQILDTVRLAREIKLDWYTIQPLNFIPAVETTDLALVEGLLTEQEVFDGTERPFVGSTGKQMHREKLERNQALQFSNVLKDNPNRVPGRNEIKDIWFMMDYEVNYRKIWTEQSLVKLQILRKLFENMCDHTHKENALGNLYFGLIEYGLGDFCEAKKRLALARKFSNSSDYWKKRFEALDLWGTLSYLENQLH